MPEGVEPYRDLILASFADLTNKGNVDELGISLLVGGSWVTGQLIGARAWFEGLARSVDAPGAGGFGDALRVAGAQAYPSESEREAAGVAEDHGFPSFLHLRDANVITGAGRPVPSQGGFVRIRVDAVTAWMLGRIGPPGYQPPPPPPPPT